MGAGRPGAGLRPFHTSSAHCGGIELRALSRRYIQRWDCYKPTGDEHGLVS